tara:strand:+ start:11921 stop:12364 length:444 start_codon:yes stop_codon:yes gene_type:complete
MAINSKIKVLRDNLKTQLSARSGLSGVDIFKFPPADGAPKTEFIFFGDASSNMDFETFGKTYEEDLELSVFVYCLKPGAGDTVAGSAQDRALTLAQEVIDELADDSTVNNAVLVSKVRNLNLENGLSDEGRFCQIEMQIDATAILSE